LKEDFGPLFFTTNVVLCYEYTCSLFAIENKSK